MVKQIQLFCAISMLSLAVFSTAKAADAFSGYYGAGQQPKVKDDKPTRDPFTNSDKMYNEVGIQTVNRANQANQLNYNYNYQPSGIGAGTGAMPMTAAIPKLRLKGLVSKPNQKPGALLEVEGAGVYYVTAGEEIGYGQGGVLKIISVSEQGVKVQAPMMNQPIVVR